jgi:hypothetical protein
MCIGGSDFYSITYLGGGAGMLKVGTNSYISREFADEYISSRYRSAIKDWSASADESADFDDDSGQKELVDAFESGA